ncbi:MAG: Clp protease N-terminal domain-containing protein, partial [Pseudohongiellaceae bacterium]
MRMDRLTSKLQMALSDAQSLALGKDHNYIEPVHLVSVLVDQKGGSIRPLLMQTGFDIAKLRNGM